MKTKTCLLLIILLLANGGYAQVLDNALTLRPGKMNLGAYLVDYENDDMGIFANLDYGLGPGYDLGLRLGLGYRETYLGAEVEWNLRAARPIISVSAGAHVFGDLGLDGTLNLTFPINRQIDIYSGLDMDINFAKVRHYNSRTGLIEETRNTQVPVWIFVGSEIGLRPNLDLVLELELDISNDAWTVISAGVNFAL